jgi:hypothetical protein
MSALRELGTRRSESLAKFIFLLDRRGVPFRSHCTKSMKVPILAPDERDTRNGDSLRRVVGGIRIIWCSW